MQMIAKSFKRHLFQAPLGGDYAKPSRISFRPAHRSNGRTDCHTAFIKRKQLDILLGNACPSSHIAAGIAQGTTEDFAYIRL
jgi:hypothetical protein